MSRIDRSSFSTASLPVDQRFPAWRESISVLFDVSVPKSSNTDHFNANMNSYLINGQCLLSVCEAGSQAFERSALHIAADGMDYYLLQVLLKGSQRVQRLGQEWIFQPGSILLIDLMSAHQAQCQGFSTLNLVIPRYLLAPHLQRPDVHGSRVINADEALVALLGNHLKMFYGAMDSLSAEQAGLMIAPTIGLVAGVLNGCMDSAQGTVESVNTVMLMRAKSEIERQLQQELTVDSLAVQLSVSRATLHRMFECFGGVRSYIQERRLRRCAESLTLGRFNQWRVCDIAYHWGFKSEAHFSRAFKQRFGMSPRQARDEGRLRHGSVPIPPRYLDTRIGDRNYEHWLVSTLRS